MTHGQCDARPTCTFPACAGTKCAGTKLLASHWRRTGHASQTLMVLHLRAQGLEEGDEHPRLRSLVEHG